MPFPPPLAAPVPVPVPASVPPPVAAPAFLAPNPVGLPAVVAVPVEAPPANVPLRWTLGPSFNAAPAVVIVPAPVVAPGVPAKKDVVVTLVGVDNAAWTVTVNIEAYDLANTNQLMEVRAVLLPAGSPVPADAPSWVASSNPVAIEDVSSVQTGGDDVINLPAVPVGAYLGQILLGFAS